MVQYKLVYLLVQNSEVTNKFTLNTVVLICHEVEVEKQFCYSKKIMRFSNVLLLKSRANKFKSKYQGKSKC